MKKILTFLAALLLTVGIASEADACSRVVYLGDKGLVLVGRTLDWRTPIPTNIYVYPRGMNKTSMPSGPMLKWTSQYATVLAVSYDGGVTEGMNEAGLTMNGLFCRGTIYHESTGASDDTTPVMSLAVFVSYFLDNFATVDEAYSWLEANEFAIFGKTFDGGTVSALHWALTDASGMSMLMEYVDGKLNLYKGRDLQVLTNDPTHPQMQAIEQYWDKVGGANMLPGTVRSSDRYVRASYFIHHVPTDYDYAHAFGSLSSIMGTVSVPLGYEIEGEPNLSSTLWTSISDAGGKYYFRPATSTGYFWVDMSRLILHPGAPVLKFDTAAHPDATGCINDLLVETAPFTPIW